MSHLAGQSHDTRSAAELFGEWRAAQRDAAAAQIAGSVAALAVQAAGSAEEGALTTETAARAAVDASGVARDAARRAKVAATQAADAAQVASSSAEGDQVRAELAVAATKAAESVARARLKKAKTKGRRRAGKPGRSEVTEGPVGSARLKNPASVKTQVDLGALPAIEPPDPSTEG